MKLLFCTILFVFSFQYYRAAITIDFDEDIRECDNGMPMPEIDLSQFSILPQEDGSLLLNGTVSLKKSYGEPIKWRMHTKRLEQGKWNPGIVSRDIPNFCPVFKMPTEPWYKVTQHLDGLRCPIKAGYAENFTNLNIGNMATVYEVPPEFIGEWRIFHEIVAIRNGFPVQECFMLPTTIAEV